jgi:hypothetical protein
MKSELETIVSILANRSDQWIAENYDMRREQLGQRMAQLSTRYRTRCEPPMCPRCSYPIRQENAPPATILRYCTVCGEETIDAKGKPTHIRGVRSRMTP